MKKEVELKVQLKDVRKAKQQLKDMGASYQGEQKETDYYYCVPGRDSITSKECLRIRVDEHKTEITYKPPSDEDMFREKQFWKEETNVFVKPESLEAAKKLLRLLGCPPISIVTKKRQTYITPEKAKITIDEIEDLGTFIEIEQEVDEANEAQAKKLNKSILAKFGLTEKDLVEKPYRDMVPKQKF